jgi:AcrR family transcriptional regulator
MRQLAEIRKEQVLEISINLAKEIGYTKITRELIAERANISVSLVNYHFKTVEHLKKLVLRFAIKRGIKKIIAQAIINNDPLAKNLSAEYKKKILKDVAHAI